MHNQQKAYLHMIVVVLFWSTVATAFKIALSHVTPLLLLFYASFVAALILLVALLLQNKHDLIWAYTKHDLLRAAFLGLINPFVFYLVLFTAYDLLPAQVAMILNYTWPITLTILSIPLLGQKIGLMNIVAIIISFAGVVIISTGGRITAFGELNPLGIGLALLSTLIWSVFWILNIKDRHEELVKLFYSFSFGCAYSALAILLTSDFVMPDWKGMTALIYVGMFEMGLTYVIWLKALKLSRTTAQVSNLIFLIPFLSLVIIRLVLNEPIYLSSLFGLIFIVAGILLQQRYSRQP
jgi:drug/metabolite transporter (DMT)-like permease